MTALPAFSIIVPLYNKAEHIQSTLHSALAQQWPPQEIIVVDDGSTDNSSAIVESMSERTIRLIKQPNGGVAKARNVGIAHATGDWTVFLDADDWQHPLFLSALADTIAQHPDVDMVASQYQSIEAARFKAPSAWPVDMSSAEVELITDLPRRWLQGASFFTSSVAVRTRRLKAMLPCFPPGENFGEDLDLWFRLAELTPIALHSMPLVARIWVPDGLSVRHVARTEPPFLLRMETRALAQALPSRLAASTLAFVDHNRMSLARSAISASQRSLAWQLLWRSRRHAFSKRWAVSMLMAALAPGSWVYRWQHWRKRRKMVIG